MIDRVLNIFSQFNGYILILVISITIFYCLCMYRKINIRNSRFLFPILYNLNNKEILKLSMLIFKYSFFLYNIFFSHDFNFRVIFIFAILDTIYNLVNYNIFGMIIDYINSFSLCMVLFFVDILFEYIKSFSYNIEYIILFCFGTIFIALYSICIFMLKLIKLKKKGVE